MSKGQSIAGRKIDYKLSNNDFYETPSWATNSILEKIEFEGNVYEPCSGHGAISRVLEEYGYDVISSDIREDYDVYGNKGVDIFTMDKENVVDNIITNPPYKFAQEVIEKSLQLANKKVVMLLKLSFLESAKRYDFFKDTPLKNVYVLCKRVTMFPHGTEKPKNSGTVAYAWFEWDNEYDGEPMIKWLDD